jgi:hypothetical protein
LTVIAQLDTELHFLQSLTRVFQAAEAVMTAIVQSLDAVALLQPVCR